MKVYNASTKTIGLGEVILKPKESAHLPKGYGKEHPVVKFFMNKGWLIEMSDGGVYIPVSPPKNAKKSDEPDTTEATDVPDTPAELNDDDGIEQSKADLLFGDDLRAYATDIGVTFASNISDPTLRARIKEALLKE